MIPRPKRSLPRTLLDDRLFIPTFAFPLSGAENVLRGRAFRITVGKHVDKLLDTTRLVGTLNLRNKTSQDSETLEPQMEEIVEAINDLTRVMIALNGEFSSKAEAVRKLAELSIPPTRIAKILAMSSSDVSSTLAKAKKKQNQAAKTTAEGEA